MKAKMNRVGYAVPAVTALQLSKLTASREFFNITGEVSFLGPPLKTIIQGDNNTS